MWCFLWHADCSFVCMIEAVYDRQVYQMAQVLMDKSLLKHQAVAANIANVETPGYKRVDLDSAFDSQLKRLLASGDTQAIASFEHKLAVDTDSPSVRPDGNNVQLEHELLAMNRNALEYEFLSKYISKSFGKIKTAITGNVSSI